MPRPDVRDERIPEILEASAEEFAVHGIDGASMAKIADRCTVSKATLYHYFETKESLITALVQSVFADDLDALRHFASDAETAIGSVRIHAAQVASLMESKPHLAALLAEVNARSRRMPEIQGILRASFSAYVEHFTAAFARGIASHELRADLDPAQTALTWVSTLEGALVVANATQRPVREVVDNVVAVFARLTASPDA